MLKSLKRYVLFTWIYLLILIIGFTLVSKLEANSTQSLISYNVELQEEIRGLESYIECIESTIVDRQCT